MKTLIISVSIAFGLMLIAMGVSIQMMMQTNTIIKNGLLSLDRNDQYRMYTNVEATFAVGCQLKGGVYVPAVFDNSGNVSKPMNCDMTKK